MATIATAAAETALRSAYDAATNIIKAQPEGEKGSVVVLSMIEDDMVGLAYGAPKDWAKMLFEVAERNENFKLALHFAMLAIQEANDDDLDY